MTPEQQQAYDDSCVPFHTSGGAISVENTKMKSWRYFLEVNSLCNLHCPTCTKGNQDGYEHQTGVMAPNLMEKILDKIKSENPEAIVFLYGNSEPFLHPHLADCIAAIKRRGLNAQFSTNLNYVHDLDETLRAGPDFIIISLSGFTQEVYVKGHVGGKIQKVKENMKLLAETNAKLPVPVPISVNYHIYTDNQHEVEPMRDYCRELGLGFFTSFARAISMENAIQYNRSLDPEATPFEVQPGRPDWNRALPPIGKTYVEAMTRLVHPPTEAQEMYKDVPLASVCPVGAGGMFTFIRHDGKTSMCACVADRRITVGDYLTTTPDEMIQQREGHAICKQCLKYRNNLYFHIVKQEQWTPPI